MDYQFLKIPDVKKRFTDYYNASLVELEDLKRFYNISIPEPKTIIFGHTHDPIPRNDKIPAKVLQRTNSKVQLYNTGGWL